MTERYITLGADEDGYVYGLELEEDGKWRRNSLGFSTSCVVIRPVSKETYKYVTEDPESAKEIWQSCVSADMTELGLREWFEEYASNDELFDMSFVHELLDDESNPTVHKYNLSIEKRIGEADKTDEADDLDGVWGEDGQPMSFKEHVKKVLLESPDVGISGEDDVCSWEASGLFPPKKPFVVEFAPKELLEEYYEHLRKTYTEFEG